MGVNKSFVVKNGFEVNDNLIFADSATKRVGISTNDPQKELDVVGEIGATNIDVSGTATINSLNISGQLNIDGVGSGSTGQYLRSTSTGVEWATLPTLRTIQTYTAFDGQTAFDFEHTPGEIDVYVNGVKLKNSEYSDSSIQVILINPAFDGDYIELIGYGVIGTGLGSTTGISGVTILDEGFPVGTVDSVTSINFVGGTVEAAGTGAGVTVTITPTSLNYIEGNGTVTGILTVGASSITLNGPGNGIDAGTITTKELKVTGGQYSTQDLSRIVDRPVGIGSTTIILDDTTNIIVGDTITVSGILTQAQITNIANVSVTRYNETFLNTNTNITIAIGSTAIGVANTNGVSIGSSITVNGYLSNVPVVGFTTISIVESPGYLNAVLISPSLAPVAVIPSNSAVGFSSAVTQRSAVFIGAASTSPIGISSGSSCLIQRFTSANSNVNVSGIVTATGGFISVGNTTPIKISVVGNKLIFTAVGIGSTSFTLF
jgi:hypothetical protein